MGIEITAFLGKTSAGLKLPPLPLMLDGQSVEHYFGKGSNEDIRLTLNDSRLGEVLAPAEPTVTACNLHEATHELTQNPMWAPEGVRKIALVFAGCYKPCESAFGVMFDRGYAASDDPNDVLEYTSVAREGCALFLDAIFEARKARPGDYEREVVFTTIHELGHVFNLQHKEEPPNFLSTSPAAQPYGSGAYHFHAGHVPLLSRCSSPESRDVWPGGAPFAENADSFDLPQLRSGLKLRLDMHQKDFWPFEPVELDVAVSVPRGGKACRIPDVVDPGYPCFRIWIEDSLGERRFYRSPLHYCGSGQRRSIAPGAPFERDITIFGQSGGYTFRMPGRHRLWATLALEGRGLVKSNVLEVTVLPPAPGSPTYRALREHLRPPKHASLLYYRSGSPEGRAVKRLAEFCDRFEDLPAAAATRYALGRLLFDAAERAEKHPNAERPADPTRLRRWKTRAAEHLDRALGHPGLSPHRRFIAGSLLERAKT